MKQGLFYILFLLQLTIVRGAGEGILPGGRTAAMGMASVASSSLWSVVTNQAGLAWMPGWQAGVYSENRFLLKEVTYGALAVSWCGKPGAFGGVLMYGGFHLYQEFRAGITYARMFGERFSAGIQFSYLRLRAGEGYGSRGMVSGDISMMFKPDGAWTLGLQVCNPVPVRITEYPAERIPLVFRLGVGYDFSGKVLILLEGEKDLEHPLEVRSGLEVRLAKAVNARIGVHSGPFMVTGGVGLSLGKVTVDVATKYHMILGFSPAISIEYHLYTTREPSRKR